MSVPRSDPSRAADAESARALKTDGEREPPDQVGDRDQVPNALKGVVLLAVMIGVVLRFVARSPLWLDEALSVNIAQLPIDQIPDALRHDGHPPLYYILLHVWMNAVGASDAAVRSLSGLFAVLCLPFAYLVGRRSGGRSLGWLNVGLFALCPFVLRYATETRMYSLIMLLVLIGYLLVDDLARRARRGLARPVGLSVVTSALCYSHYWALWLLAGTMVVLVGGALRSKSPSCRRGSVLALGAMVAGGLSFVPWLGVLAYQSRHTGTPWAGPVRPTSLIASSLTDFGGGAFKDAQFVGAVLLALVLLGVFGTAINARRIDLDLRTAPQFRPEAAVVSATIVLALAVSYATRSAFVTRYASTFLPLVLLLAAGGLSRFLDLRVRTLALTIVLGLFGLGCVYNLTTDRTQAKVIAAEVTKHHHADDLVVYCPDQLGPAALRLMPDDVRQIAFPTMDRPNRIDWVDYNERNMVDPSRYARDVLDAAGAAKGIFVVWSGGYKTHQGTCDALVAAIASERHGEQTLVSEDGDLYFEHANLTYFAPPNPARGS